MAYNVRTVKTQNVKFVIYVLIRNGHIKLLTIYEKPNSLEYTVVSVHCCSSVSAGFLDTFGLKIAWASKLF
jgi:hypothetical protein